jgi:hypothetical protein
MPNTTNFNWPTPADTDLVKDGAAAIRNLGDGVDTSLVDLKGGTTGQILSKASDTDMDFAFITPNVGDVTEVQAGVGISVASGTGPIPVITNSSTDLITTAGDLLYGTAADTVARLGIGTASQVLAVNSGATAPEWVTPAAGGGMTLLHTVAMTGASTITQSGISGSYKHLLIVFNNISTASGGNDLNCQLNSDSSTKYRWWDNWYLNGSGGNNQAAAGSSFGLSIRTPSSNTAADTIDGFMWIYDYTRTTGVSGNSVIGGTTTSSTLIFNQTQFKYSNSAAISAISIIGPSNFDQGNMYIYGVN